MKRSRTVRNFEDFLSIPDCQEECDNEDRYEVGLFLDSEDEVEVGP